MGKRVVECGCCEGKSRSRRFDGKWAGMGRELLVAGRWYVHLRRGLDDALVLMQSNVELARPDKESDAGSEIGRVEVEE